MRIIVAILHQYFLDCLSSLLSCKYSSFYDIRWGLSFSLYDARLAFFISSDCRVFWFFLWFILRIKCGGVWLAWIIESWRGVFWGLYSGESLAIEYIFLTRRLLPLRDLCVSNLEIARRFLTLNYFRCCLILFLRALLLLITKFTLRLFRWGWCTNILSVFPFRQGWPLGRFLLQLLLRLLSLLLLLLLLLFLRWFCSS